MADSIALKATGAGAHPQAPALNVRRLLWIRMIAVPGAALLFLLVQRLYGLPLQTLPLLMIMLALVGYNLWLFSRLGRGATLSEREFFLQMLVDVLALTGILYYSGGASNPFVFFFLLPLVITATVLPRRLTWAMALITACCYTLLLLAGDRVADFMHHVGAGFGNLHVFGMWLGFVLIAGLIAHFVAGMAETLRERDRRLAEAREQALRDEQVLALATLAAGAAHELSTPLATMKVLTGELRERFAGSPDPALGRQLGILEAQVDRCKEALSVISASAGATRAEAGQRERLDRYLARLCSMVRSLRPGAEITIIREDPSESAPMIYSDQLLSQAILNIIHNAVDASPRSVRVLWRVGDGRLWITVCDQGGGIRADALEMPGQSSKEGGLGLGLFLTRTAIRQFGGEIGLDNRDGGAQVSLCLPLERLTVATV